MLLNELFTNDSSEGVSYVDGTLKAKFAIDGDPYTVRFQTTRNADTYEITFHLDANAGLAMFNDTNKGVPLQVFGKVMAATKMMIASLHPSRLLFKASSKRLRIYKKMLQKSLAGLNVGSIREDGDQIVIDFKVKGDDSEGLRPDKQGVNDALEEYASQIRELQGMVGHRSDLTSIETIVDAARERFQKFLSQARESTNQSELRGLEQEVHGFIEQLDAYMK